MPSQPKPVISQHSTLKRLSILLCVLALVSCSLRVSYPFMDWWMGWKVKDYLTLTNAQDEQLDKALDRFHLWHQKTQLVVYANEIDGLKMLLRQPTITPPELEAYGEEANAYWLVSLDYLLPDMQKLFLTLSDEQWAEFKQNLTEHIEDEAEPALKSTPEERIEDRAEQFEESVEKWTGRLAKEQKQLIVQWSQRLHPLIEIGLQEKKLWITKADQVYLQRLDVNEGELHAQLNDLISGDSSRWTPHNQQLLEENRQQTLKLVCALHSSLTDKQQKHLFKRLESYQSDLLYLYQKTQAER